MKPYHEVKLRDICNASPSGEIPLRVAAKMLGLKYHNLYSYFRKSGWHRHFTLRKGDGGLLFIRAGADTRNRNVPLIPGRQNSNFPPKTATSGTIRRIDEQIKLMHEIIDQNADHIEISEILYMHDLLDRLDADLKKNDYRKITPALNAEVRKAVANFETKELLMPGTYDAIVEKMRLLYPRAKVPNEQRFKANSILRKHIGWGEFDRNQKKFAFFGPLQRGDFFRGEELFRKYIRDAAQKKIILIDSDYQEHRMPYKTRFTDNGRKKVLRETFEDAFLTGISEFKEATFITLTTNPAKFDNMDDANRAMSKNWNKMITALRKKHKGAAFINVREFQKNGRLHLHVVVFGVTLEQDVINPRLDEYTNSWIKELWEKYGQGSITNTIPLAYDKSTGTLGWGKHRRRGELTRPDDCGKNENPIDYLKKYLSKVLQGNRPVSFDKTPNEYEPADKMNRLMSADDLGSGFAHADYNAASLWQYWANNCRFFTNSRCLISADRAKALQLKKIIKEARKSEKIFVCVGVYNEDADELIIKHEFVDMYLSASAAETGG